jgi:hypothetical protein
MILLSFSRKPSAKLFPILRAAGIGGGKFHFKLVFYKQIEGMVETHKCF